MSPSHHLADTITSTLRSLCLLLAATCAFHDHIYRYETVSTDRLQQSLAQIFSMLRRRMICDLRKAAVRAGKLQLRIDLTRTF